MGGKVVIRVEVSFFFFFFWGGRGTCMPANFLIGSLSCYITRHHGQSSWSKCFKHVRHFSVSSASIQVQVSLLDSNAMQCNTADTRKVFAASVWWLECPCHVVLTLVACYVHAIAQVIPRSILIATTWFQRQTRVFEKIRRFLLHYSSYVRILLVKLVRMW